MAVQSGAPLYSWDKIIRARGGGKGWLGGWGALLKQQNIRELFRYSAAEMFFPEYQNICIFVFQTWAQVVNQDFPGTRV